jgi:hypothetical protein
MNYIIKQFLIDRVSYDNYMNIYHYIEEYNEHPLVIHIRQYFFKKRFTPIHNIIQDMFYLAYYKHDSIQEIDKPLRVRVFTISINNIYIKNTICSYCGNFDGHQNPNMSCKCDAYSDLPNLYPFAHILDHE